MPFIITARLRCGKGYAVTSPAALRQVERQRNPVGTLHRGKPGYAGASGAPATSRGEGAPATSRGEGAPAKSRGDATPWQARLRRRPRSRRTSGYPCQPSGHGTPDVPGGGKPGCAGASATATAAGAQAVARPTTPAWIRYSHSSSLPPRDQRSYITLRAIPDSRRPASRRFGLSL